MQRGTLAAPLTSSYVPQWLMDQSQLGVKQKRVILQEWPLRTILCSFFNVKMPFSSD